MNLKDSKYQLEQRCGEITFTPNSLRKTGRGCDVEIKMTIDSMSEGTLSSRRMLVCTRGWTKVKGKRMIDSS